MFSSKKIPDSQERLQIKLNTALKIARVTCVLGATNKYADFVRTSGWSAIQFGLTAYLGGYVKHGDPATSQRYTPTRNTYDYNVDLDLNPSVTFSINKGNKPNFSVGHWFYSTELYEWVGTFERHQKINKDPIRDTAFEMTDDLLRVINSAITSRIKRYGTCMNYAALIFMYLWEKSEGIQRIEIMRQPGMDHEYVVINRSGIAEDPHTWGDAWIIDGWYDEGIIYHACEFQQKINEIKAACDKDVLILAEHVGIKFEENPNVHDDNRVIAEVKPAINIYPSYDRVRSLFDYYQFSDERFLPLSRFVEYKAVASKHKYRMQPTLAALSLFANDANNVKPSQITHERKKLLGS